MKLDKTIKYILISEFLFTLLPIVILIIVKNSQNDFSSLFYNTEWSIISLILFGQTIVKFSSGISHTNLKIKWQFVAMIISVIIVFGLIPSSIILVINLLSDTLSFALYFTQIVFFIVSCFSFFIIGAIGQKMLDNKNSHLQNEKPNQ